MGKFKKIIGILLIVVGLSLIFSVACKKYITNKKNDQLIENFNESLKEPEIEVDNEDYDKKDKEEIGLYFYKATPTDNTIQNEIIVTFNSLETATTLTIPDDVAYEQDFTVESNKRYELSFLWSYTGNGWQWVMESNGGKTYANLL